MTAKLKYDKVASFITQQGYKLLDTEYYNSKYKMRVVCPQGHEFLIKWNNFQIGRRCAACSNIKKYTYSEVSNIFYKGGCELLETEYKNNSQPLKYKCVCKNISKISLTSFLLGRKCKKCAKVESPTFSEVKKLFVGRGCKLFENRYVNCKHLMHYECKCGFVGTVSWADFKSRKECRNCWRKSISGPGHHCWNKNRQEVAIRKSVRKKVYRALQSVLEAFHKHKFGHASCLMGYSVDDLKNHLEERHGIDVLRNMKGMHLDHIFPISAFVSRDIYDIKTINSLDNLQLLPARQNISKGDYYDCVKFDEWLNGKGWYLQEGKWLLS